MENKMTTKRALIVVGLFFGTLALSLVVPAKYFGVEEKKKQGLILRSPQELSKLSGDADGNGIPDWKDTLKSQIGNTELKEEKTTNTEENSKLDDPNNLTASFSKNVLMAGAYNNNSESISDIEKEVLANQLLEGESKKIIIKTYSLSDIKIDKNETPTKRKEYGNNLGKIYNGVLSLKIGSNDLAIIKSYTINKDASVLESIVVKKNIVEKVINDLLSLSAPNSASTYHLLLINALSQYKTTLENLSQIKEDPVRATIAFNGYLDTVGVLSSALSSMQTYFIVCGVTFSTKDPGHSLILGYTN